MGQEWLVILKDYIRAGNEIETPCYIYDRAGLLRNIEFLKRSFEGIARLFFAVKANTNLRILNLIKEHGIGAEVVSPGEIFVCKKAGFKGSEILYNNVARKQEEIIYALKNGITFFNFESLNQARILAGCAEKMNRRIKAFVRINPGIFPKTHPHLSTGSEWSKFGIRMEELPEVANILKGLGSIELVGIHCHIGSQILSPLPFIRAIKRVGDAIEYLRNKGYGIRYVNLGGGFGVPYKPSEKPLDFKPIVESYRGFKDRYRVEIFLEPGRFFVASAGYILTRLIDKKERNYLPVYMIDAGMTENPRPALYDAYHHIEPLFNNGKKRIKVRITGPLCENADEFGVFMIPDIEIGDYLLVHNCGAYTRTMASTYNGRPLCAEYFIGHDIEMIRKRQDYRRLVEDEGATD
uniref:Diaminopimelate decarboxylase n=1 Tax=candidate division WOR-3 bacterium TaxID=2052148 RepID=A0A7V3RHN8_UNCW3